MSTDLIRYDVLVQQALRGVVRKVLTDAAKEGLPGSHHFYISFNTGAPGAKISPRLKSMYPDEMTIVLQHQYWDFAVNDTGFEVSLSFDKIAERLIVPYEAVTGFFDPSVKFGLKFEAADSATVHDDSVEKPVAKGKAKSSKKAEAEAGPAAEPTRIGKKPAKAQPAEAKPEKAEPAGAESSEGSADEAAKPAGTAEVVSLDAFRKKK